MRWLALLCLSCTPAHPSGGIAVTGKGAPLLTVEERAGISERIGNTVECLRQEGFTVRNRVVEVRVHSSCRFRKAGYTIAGYSNLRDTIELGIDLAEVEHEAAAVMVGSHSHDPLHPSMLCGAPVKREWFRTHSRRKCP